MTGRDIQDLYNVARGSSSIGQIQAVITGALKLAVREGLIPRNVSEGLTVVGPERAEREPPIWSPVQLRVFLDGVSDHWLYPLYHVAAYTGLRIGELIALQWDDISLDMALLFVRQSKSTAGRRRVALDPDTVALLRQHRVSQAQRRAALGPDWLGGSLVFDRGDGSPVSPRTIEAVMARTVRRLNLVPALTPHGLRHNHASHLVAAGVPLTLIQQRLGHANYSTTANFYIHHGPVDERRAIEAFAAHMRRAEPAHPHDIPTEEQSG